MNWANLVTYLYELGYALWEELIGFSRMLFVPLADSFPELSILPFADVSLGQALLGGFIIFYIPVTLIKYFI